MEPTVALLTDSLIYAGIMVFGFFAAYMLCLFSC
jgi:hypothetical protein